MSTATRLAVATLLIGAGTYAIRASFLLFAHRLVDMPATLREALRMIPPAVFAALTVPVLLRREGDLDLLDARLLAALLAAFVAWYTRNLLATIGVGLIAVLLLQGVPVLQ